MKTRLLTSVYIVIAVILAFLSKFLTPYIFDVVIGCLAIIGATEMGRVFERSKLYNNIYIVGSFPAALYVGMAVGFNTNWLWEEYVIYFLALILVYFVTCFLLTILMKKTTAREMNKYQILDSKVLYAFKKSMNSLAILLYPTLMFFTLFFLNHIFDLSVGIEYIGIPIDFYFLLTVFAVTMATDSLALVVGSLVKGPKLCPKVSPNKTISGAVGGLAGGVLAAFLVYWLFSINKDFVTAFNAVANLWTVASLGFFGSIVSQLGDLFASFLKRKARVKDYGTLFPGHGGVMDRVDGLIFNASFVLIFVLFLL